MTSTWQSGSLVVWKDDRGFGFIQSDTAETRVFLHITALKAAPRRPQVGDAILYQTARDKKGKTFAAKAYIRGLRPSAEPVSKAQYSHRRTQQPALVGLQSVLLAGLPLTGAVQFALKTANPLPLGLYLLMSLVAYAAYVEDKSRAQKSRWRISENTLHLLELAGGWIGAFVAQRTIRHKNRKGSYQAVFRLIVALHYVFWIYWLAGSFL